MIRNRRLNMKMSEQLQILLLGVLFTDVLRSEFRNQSV